MCASLLPFLQSVLQQLLLQQSFSLAQLPSPLLPPFQHHQAHHLHCLEKIYLHSFNQIPLQLQEPDPPFCSMHVLQHQQYRAEDSLWGWWCNTSNINAMVCSWDKLNVYITCILNKVGSSFDYYVVGAFTYRVIYIW